MATTAQRIAVLIVAIVSGLVAALAGASPTGDDTVDRILVIVGVALVVWLGSNAPWRVPAGAALVAGAASASIPMAAIGVVTFGLAVGASRRPADQWIIGAVVSGVAMNLAARSELGGFMGLSALVAVALGAVIGIAGLTRSDRRSRIVILGGLGAVAVLALVGVTATAYAASRSINTLESANDDADRGVRLLGDGNLAEASAAFESAAVGFELVEERLGTPFGSTAALVPIAAQQRTAALEMSRQAARTSALISEELALVDLDALTTQPGRIDLDAVRSLETPLADIQAELDDLAATIDDVRNQWLVSALDDRLDDLAFDVEQQQQRGTDTLELVRAVPALLGADEPRSYFVAFTTPAEARGLGGLMGNYAVMSVDDGRFELTEFGRHDRLDKAAPAGARVLDGPDEWLRQYGRFGFTSSPGETVGAVPWTNYTMSPQADSAGDVAAQLFPQSGGADIDGYFALDIFAVSRLLEFTGPIDTEYGERLDADNAADFLLNGQYVVAERPDRVDLLEDVSRQVIDRLLSEPLPEPRALFGVTRSLVDQGRLVGWAARDEEQQLFESSGLAGGLPDPAVGDAVAITFNNAVGNKIDYFLRARANYDVTVDAATSTARATMVVQMENTAPAEGQVPYVVGNNIGLPSGTNRTYVSVYTRLPVESVSIDGEPIVPDTGSEAGYFVTSMFIDTLPDTPRAITLNMAGNVDLSNGYELWLHSPPTIRRTPLAADVTVENADGAIVHERSIETEIGTTSTNVPVL